VKAERRPAKAALSDSTAAKTDSIVSPEADEDAQRVPEFDAVAAMRRRREAALRMPPLESGYRDPQFGFRRDGAAS
jgi:hypothetical protein